MNETARALFRQIQDAMAAIYGQRLRGVYLYGSYARGEQDHESDMDVLVVLDAVSRYGEEIERTSAVVSEISLRYGISISRTFLSEQDWAKGQTPFLVNVREEAIIP